MSRSLPCIKQILNIHLMSEDSLKRTFSRVFYEMMHFLKHILSLANQLLNKMQFFNWQVFIQGLILHNDTICISCSVYRINIVFLEAKNGQLRSCKIGCNLYTLQNRSLILPLSAFFWFPRVCSNQTLKISTAM